METLFSETAPEEFLCGISLTVMRDPVVLPSGETYERNSIIRAGLRDPQTREQLTDNQLTSNRALRRQIDKYLTSSVEQYILTKIEAAKSGERSEAWKAICTLFESLVDDDSEPALFAHKRVFSLLENKDGESSFVQGFVDLEDPVQESVLNTLMRIPSSLAKGCLYTLLSQYSGHTLGESTPQRSKRPRRNSPTSSVRAIPSHVATIPEKIVSKIGLHGLFSSHDSSEVELACNFALLFMRKPFQHNCLNSLGQGESAHQMATFALKKVLCSNAVTELRAAGLSTDGSVLNAEKLIAKQVIQELITTLSLWCSNLTASAAARSIHESETQLSTFLWLLCGPPWPQVDVVEPVLSALFCNGTQNRTSLQDQLRGPCKPMLDWFVAEMQHLGGSDDDDDSTHIVDLLRSFAHIGYGIEQLMVPSKKRHLTEPEAALIRKLLLALAKDVSVNNQALPKITEEYLQAFTMLALRTPLKHQDKAAELNRAAVATGLGVIAEKAMLSFGVQPEKLFEACLQVADAARHRKKSCENIAHCEHQALLLARDITLQCCGGFRAALSSSCIPAQGVMRLVRALLSSDADHDLNSEGLGSHQIYDSAVALMATHSITCSDVASASQQLPLALRQVELQQLHLRLQPLCQRGQHPSRVSPWGLSDSGALTQLLECGLQSPLTGVLQHFFENVSETPASRLQELLSQLECWARRCTTFEQLLEPLFLLQTFAKQSLQMRTMLSMQTLDLVHATLNTKVTGESVSAMVAAAEVLNCMLADKGNSDATLPAKLYKREVLQTLFRAMTDLPNNQALHEVAIQVAFKLTSRCKDVEYTSAEIDVLLKAMWKWDMISIRCPAFGIQMYLSTRKDYKKRLCQQDCVTTVLDAVEAADADIVVVRHGCGVLRNAARNVMEPEAGASQIGFPWSRMAKVTIRLMQAHPLDQEIQYRGCGVLVNIASAGDYAREELHCDVVLKAARAHRSHAELQLWALHFYIQFEGNKESPRDPGPLPARVGEEIATVMREYTSNVELQLLCLTVYGKLIQQYAQSAKKLRELLWAKEVFFLTCDALREHMKKEDVCPSALRIIDFYHGQKSLKIVIAEAFREKTKKLRSSIVATFKDAEKWLALPQNSLEVDDPELAKNCCKFIEDIQAGT